MPRLVRNRSIRGNYPIEVKDLLDPPMVFIREAADVVSAFAKSRPYVGDVITKRFTLHSGLNKAYGINPVLRFGLGMGSFYDPKKKLIMLDSTSVTTQLHEFAHALNGSDEEYAVRWSLNMYRSHFPMSFSRLRFEGHLVAKSAKWPIK